MPAASLKNWMTAARTGKLQDVGKEQRAPTDLELELARVRKELAEVKRSEPPRLPWRPFGLSQAGVSARLASCR